VPFGAESRLELGMGSEAEPARADSDLHGINSIGRELREMPLAFLAQQVIVFMALPGPAGLRRHPRSMCA
jgi:hypothetical protein